MTDSRRWGQQYALYLPRTLLAWQAAPDPAPVYETEGTFLLVDISGFTAMSEMLAEKGKVGSEEVTDVLNAAFTELLDIVMLDGGDLLRFGGDALFNLFTGKDHAARACRSALDMRDALEEFQQTRSPAPLKMSVGLASGPITGVLAGEQFHELLFVGPTASEVVALQTAAEPGEILISKTTLDLVDDPTIVGDEKAGGYLLEDEPDVDDFEEDEPSIDISELDIGSFIPTRLRDHLSLSFNEGEHRPATIAFLKFTGTDQVFADEGAAELQSKLNELVTITQHAADRYGVSLLAADVDDDGGKLILATGVPERSPGQGERIVNALRDIIDATPPFPLHAGVARGHVFAGDLGARFRRVYTVMGDTVNLAARLAAEAGDGEIYTTARALDHAADGFDTTEIEPIALKGKAKPVAPLQIGELLSSDDQAGIAAVHPLIGRHQEVDSVYEIAAEAVDGFGHTLEVTGRPGMGKSRIVSEALSRLAVAPGLIQVTCERYESATPFHAAAQLVRAALELKEREADQLAADLTAAIDQQFPAERQWLPLIADVVRTNVPATPEVEALAEQFRQQTLHDVILRILAGLLDEPTSIIIEDSHWADESSRLLFASVAEHVSEHPWLIVALRSSDEGHALIDDVATIDIGPLSEGAAVELVTAVAGDATPLPLAEEVARRSGGNPFYIVELAGAMETYDVGDLPESIEAVTLARIDRLRQNDRRLLRYASVFGETFAVDLLADAMPDVAPNIDDAEVWHRLEEFLDTSSIGKVRFKQMLVRDVAYAGLPFKRRAEIHQAIAEALERRARRRPERFAEAMSLHFDRAEDWERSWTYSRMAGDRAVKKMAHVEAMRIYRRGLRAADHLADADPADLLHIEEGIGDAGEHLGLFDEAEAAYDSCVAGDIGNTARGRLLRKKGLLHVARGEFDVARPILDESLDTLTGDGESSEERVEAELESMIAMAGLHFRLGDYNSTVDWCTRAIDLAGGGHRKELAHAYYMRSVAYSHLAGYSGADDGAHALEIYEELNDLVGQTNVLNNLGYDAYYRGAWDEAVEMWSRSVETGTKSGDIVRTASSIHNLGEIFLDQGHYEDVEDRLRQALRIWQGASFVIGTALAHANLARLYTRRGDLARAEQSLDAARAGFTEAGAGAYVIEEIIRRCEWQLYSQQPEEALSLAVTTIEANEAVEGTEVSRASLHRMAAYAKAALGEHDAACEHVNASLDLARTAASDYEIAQTLEAAHRIEGPDPERVQSEDELMHKLGIVTRPWLPLGPGGA